MACMCVRARGDEIVSCCVVILVADHRSLQTDERLEYGLLSLLLSYNVCRRPC
jgi:hypothetical protein